MTVAVVCLFLAALVLVPTILRERNRRQHEREARSHPTRPRRPKEIDRSRVIDGHTVPSRSLAALCPEQDATRPDSTVR